MNLRKVFFATVFSTLLAGTAVLAQTPPPKQEKPKFDAELAKKLGGDKNGMKMYVIAFLKTGPKDIPAGKERTELFQGHMANINRLADEGKLAVAGPFEKNDGGFRGIFILNVESIEEARKLVETDPVVKAGLMIFELYKWYGSASLMATPEIHKKIAESAF